MLIFILYSYYLFITIISFTYCHSNQSNISELKDKSSTCTQTDETEIYTLLKNAGNLIVAIARRLKLFYLKSIVSEALIHADKVVRQTPTTSNVFLYDNSNNDDHDEEQEDEETNEGDNNNNALNTASTASSSTIGGNKRSKTFRKKYTGPGQGSKAALILRVAFETIKRHIDASCIIQKYYRSYYVYKKYQRLLMYRKECAKVLLLSWLAYKARQFKHKLYLQQTAEWEQLWDDNRGVLYYYNRVTQESTYFEPDTYFRPLVRDRETSALIQAWPHLDVAYTYGQVGETSNMYGDDVIQCCLCRIRRAVRYEKYINATTGVGVEVGEAGYTDAEEKPYCFVCYNKEFATMNESMIFESASLSHGSDGGSSAHQHQQPVTTVPSAKGLDTMSSLTMAPPLASTLLDPQSRPSSAVILDKPMLLCIECNTSATRQCLCFFHDEDIERLVYALQNHVNDKITTKMSFADSVIMAQNNITEIMNNAFEKCLHKLPPFLEILITDPTTTDASNNTNNKYKKKGIIITPDQFQKLQVLFNELRFECNDNYCDSCYLSSHAKGKRVMHKWLGYRDTTGVCEGCKNKPADWICPECDEYFDREAFEKELQWQKDEEERRLEQEARDLADSNSLISSSMPMVKQQKGHEETVGKIYCSHCYDIYHSHGAKKLHKKYRQILKDKLLVTDRLGYCQVCQRRPAGKTCPYKKCQSSPSCLSCYDCLHEALCTGIKPT